MTQTLPTSENPVQPASLSEAADTRPHGPPGKADRAAGPGPVWRPEDELGQPKGWNLYGVKDAITLISHIQNAFGYPLMECWERGYAAAIYERFGLLSRGGLVRAFGPYKDKYGDPAYRAGYALGLSAPDASVVSKCAARVRFLNEGGERATANERDAAQKVLIARVHAAADRMKEGVAA